MSPSSLQPAAPVMPADPTIKAAPVRIPGMDAPTARGDEW